MTILEVNNLKKFFTTRFGGNQVQSLTNVSFSVEEGEFVTKTLSSADGSLTRTKCNFTLPAAAVLQTASGFSLLAALIRP